MKWVDCINCSITTPDNAALFPGEVTWYLRHDDIVLSSQPDVCAFYHFHHIFDEIIIVPGCAVGMEPMVRLLVHRAVDVAGPAVEIGGEGE